MSDLNRNDNRVVGHDDHVAATARDGESAHVAATAPERGNTTRENVLEKEKAEFGGMKFGSAFFGWLTATGTAVILTAILAATGTAIGMGNNADATDVAEGATSNAGTVGLVGGIVLAVIVFIAYFAGGYVAGRMARFDGVRQGVAVWLWALIIAIVLAVLGLVAGSQFNVLSNLNSFPRIPVNEGDLTVGAIVTAVVIALLSLAGAILGGLAGMRYHRRVDRVGLGR